MDAVLPPADADPPRVRFVVRDAQPDDVDAIWELLREFAVYEKLEHLATGSARRLADHLFGEAWPRIECVVAEADSGLVGYAIYFGGYSTFWTEPLMWLEDIFVTERFRGAGAGKALLAEVARIAVERGCPRLDWSVLEWNRPSIEFYERLGAKRAGGWYAYRLTGEDLVRLAREARS